MCRNEKVYRTHPKKQCPSFSHAQGHNLGTYQWGMDDTKRPVTYLKKGRPRRARKICSEGDVISQCIKRNGQATYNGPEHNTRTMLSSQPRRPVPMTTTKTWEPREHSHHVWLTSDDNGSRCLIPRTWLDKVERYNWSMLTSIRSTLDFLTRKKTSKFRLSEPRHPTYEICAVAS